MIPSRQNTEFEFEQQPTHTYHLHYNRDIMGGFVDELPAMEQAVYKCLHTERYQYLIYSWNYGMELQDLFGQPIPFVYSELKRRIREALLQDDRITDVYNFAFSNKKGEVLATFCVTTTEGEFNSELRVPIGTG